MTPQGAPRRSRGTEALLALEDARPDLLLETVPGTDTLVWPLLRMPLAQTTAESELGTSAVRRRTTRAQALLRAVARAVPSRHDSRAAPRAGLLFIAGGGTTTRTRRGVRNWLIGSFADAFGDDAVIVQDAPLARRAEPADRPAFARTYSFDDAASRTDVAARLRPLPEPALSHADAVIAAILAAFDHPVEPARLDRVRQQVLYRLGRLRHLDLEFARLLDRVDPSLVVMDGACYGGRSTVIRELKRRGIPVAEPQHGWIGPTHAAYNHGAAMWSGDLRRTLPDALLTFGPFWSSGLRSPVPAVAIGKPHLDEAIRAREDGPRERVLLVSSVFDTAELTRVGLTLRRALPSRWRVVVRPHPSERRVADRVFAELLATDGVELDASSDLYDALSAADTVVGFASTVLYEALAFGARVLVIESALADLYADRAVFPHRIGDEESVLAAAAGIAVGGAQDPVPTGRSSGVWIDRPVERFTDFVARARRRA